MPALKVIEEIGRRVTEAKEDPKETMYLFQWPFRGEMRCHSSTPSTKTTSRNPSQSTIFLTICARRRKKKYNNDDDDDVDDAGDNDIDDDNDVDNDDNGDDNDYDDGDDEDDNDDD